MYVILFAIFIDLVGFGLIIPILPFLTLEMVGETYTLDIGVGSPIELSAAAVGTALMAIYSLAAFAMGPVWGRLSDRFGRKPTLTASFIGGTLAYGLLAYADTIAMVFVARALSGAMAGNVGIVMAAMADLTDNDDRGRAMGLIGGAFGLGFAFGPAIGGLLAGVGGTNLIFLPGLVAAGLSLSAAVLTVWRVPETNIARTQETDPRPALVSIFKGPGRIVLFAMFVITAVGQSLNYSIVPFWAEAVLDWQTLQVGFLMMGVGLMVFVIQTFLVGPLFRSIGEVNAVALGAAVQLAGCTLLIVVPASPEVTILAVPMVMSGLTLCFPALNSLLSRRTDYRQQGTALGFSSGLSALGRVVGPLYAGYLFVPENPDLPFVAVLVVGLITLAWTGIERLRTINA